MFSQSRRQISNRRRSRQNRLRQNRLRQRAHLVETLEPRLLLASDLGVSSGTLAEVSTLQNLSGNADAGFANILAAARSVTLSDTNSTRPSTEVLRVESLLQSNEIAQPTAISQVVVIDAAIAQHDSLLAAIYNQTLSLTDVVVCWTPLPMGLNKSPNCYPNTMAFLKYTYSHMVTRAQFGWDRRDWIPNQSLLTTHRKWPHGDARYPTTPTFIYTVVMSPLGRKAVRL